jgi:CHAT domain-containing protein
VAPPRTIKDITAILDSEKPDPRKVDAISQKADTVPGPNQTRRELAQFHYDRGNARAALGRLNDALADARKALEIGKGVVDANMMGRLRQFTALLVAASGDPKQSISILTDQIRETNVKGAKGFLFGAYRQMSALLIQVGDLAQAEAFMRRNATLIQEARTSGMPAWRASYQNLGQSWEAQVELNRAMLFEARGQFRDAEASYRLSEQRTRAGVPGVLRSANPPPEGQLRLAADQLLLAQARMIARQGRRAEAEAVARRALLARLKDQGKFTSATGHFVMGLADILVEQGRYSEAEKLALVSLEINKAVGVSDDAQSTVQILSGLAAVLDFQHKTNEAAQVYAKLDQAISGWAQGSRQKFQLNTSRIYSMYAAGDIDKGISAAQALLGREIRRVGENHFDSAAARGVLAIGLMKAGRDADASREFRVAIPQLVAAARENIDDDAVNVAARSERLQTVVESYIQILARGTSSDQQEVAAETFKLADTVRARSVQQALSASSARMLASEPALAELARAEQDLTKQIGAQLGTLNNVLGLPSGERDEKGVATLNASITSLRAAREKVKANIGKQFPDYADLIDPKAPSVREIRDSLQPDEVMLSYFFGRDASFVWAIPKNGPTAFATISVTSGDIDSAVHQLRAALEPNAETLGEIPPFDIELAHGLYLKLLAPVLDAWKPARSLVVVTNGALGSLPLSLLPTAPVQLTLTNELFGEYRTVPWLARSHAVTTVPSAAAFKTLRGLPPGSSEREKLIAFGDPIFGVVGAKEATSEWTVQAAVVTRSMPLRRRAKPQTQGVDSADLAQLPQLPDTAAELRAMALALEADTAKVLFLGKEANEQRVKGTDLSKYKIIAFATHGLVPGDLNGLVQPALALSAPKIAGVEGDGLLTMEEILTLKLDADWVVLSACNTGAAAGAGAEAASGLGRAFFYAGTRAILVTNWSVHSASARELVSELFRRQSSDRHLSKSEALRQAMVALMNGEGFKDEDGSTLFSYAHPLFWGPYTMIGDGS